MPTCLFSRVTCACSSSDLSLAGEDKHSVFCPLSITSLLPFQFKSLLILSLQLLGSPLCLPLYLLPLPPHSFTLQRKLCNMVCTPIDSANPNPTSHFSFSHSSPPPLLPLLFSPPYPSSCPPPYPSSSPPPDLCLFLLNLSLLLLDFPQRSLKLLLKFTIPLQL